MRRAARVGGGAAAGLALLATVALQPPPHGPVPAAVSADAALLLSGDVDFLRVRRAVSLYARGDVRWILMTGSGIGGDDAKALAAEAVKAHVPVEAILLEPVSRTTRENLLFAAPIIRARGWRRIALVTSDSHMARAERVARRVLPEIEWVPAPVADAGPPSRVYRQRLTEWVKLVGYGLRGWL